MARWTLSLPFLALLVCSGQTADQPPYLNPDLPAGKRAADLVGRMTLEEKVLQMQNSAPALPRLNIPAYDWWNEALHGVARAGQATVFPQAIGLAATFDTGLMYRIADIISTEARAKYNEAIRNNNHGRYYGLTFWSPNINIFRDPRWGRGQETYGEDPYLTGRLAVAFIKGLQGEDPHYFKVIATAKHYAVHSGPEPSRHQFDVRPSERDLTETYLPAFHAAMVEGKADSIMCAYNAVDGVPACANTDLLQKYLRGEWKFQGYVVSDCGAIADIYRGHKYKATAAEASAVAVKAGTDLTCGNEYRSLVDAVKSGLITEAEIDRSLERLFVARFKLGMFDPPERVPFSKIPYSVNDSEEHRKVALEAARKSIVLLKNSDAVLPLKSAVRKIAVIGPSADDAVALLGNYNGFSSHHVTPLEGIRKEFAGKAETRYALGATYTSQTPSAMPAGGKLQPPVTGEYTLVIPAGRGGPLAKVFLDDKEVTDPHVKLEAGKSYALRVEPSQPPRPGFPPVQVSWIPPADALLADAVDAAKSADVAIAFVGLNPNLEGEEMRVQIPGFAGGDRTDLKLPETQEKLVEALVAAGKPVVVVLTSGSALAANYAAEHAAAVLQLWYGGEECGTAIAETLSGTNNPAGRLPVTFYKSADQLPPFEDYSMKGRTYRYFTGDALYGFGYGLSYAKFQYSSPRSRRTAQGAEVSVRVKNDSTREGDEVAQLYIDGAGAAGDPIRELRGFQRIHLKAGESRELMFTWTDPPKGHAKFNVGSGQPLPQIPHVSGTL
jgi:beta-glucosidase